MERNIGTFERENGRLRSVMAPVIELAAMMASRLKDEESRIQAAREVHAAREALQTRQVCDEGKELDGKADPNCPDCTTLAQQVSPPLAWVKVDHSKEWTFTDGSELLLAVETNKGWDLDCVRVDCDEECGASFYYRGGGDAYDAWTWDDVAYFITLDGDAPTATAQHDNRICECRGIPNQVCDTCQGVTGKEKDKQSVQVYTNSADNAGPTACFNHPRLGIRCACQKCQPDPHAKQSVKVSDKAIAAAEDMVAGMARLERERADESDK